MLVLPKTNRSGPHRAGTLIAALLLLVIPVMAQVNYSAERLTVDGVAIVRLTDSARRAEVSIAPSIGNNSYDMKVNGSPVFWSPYASVADFQKKPTFLGNPFLAPWANRLDRDAFFANGKQYTFNPHLKNVRFDQNRNPIHGLISSSSDWEVVEVRADSSSAWVTSRFEFWKFPDLMAQFPFAHNILMTYRLRDGALEVYTEVENLSNQPMPLAIGYHPYFRLADTKRDSWKVNIAARDHVVLSSALIPTGERKPVSFTNPIALATTQLDDVFTNLIRGADGRAEFWVESGPRRITVAYGPKYPVAVIYAPPGRDFICFEPMTGVTNAFNLAHEGKYPELQVIAPGAKWSESFWISTSGY
jgi:aldose 1-epimerase